MCLVCRMNYIGRQKHHVGCLLFFERYLFYICRKNTHYNWQQINVVYSTSSITTTCMYTILLSFFFFFLLIVFYYIREFVNQGYKTEKLFKALNKLAQNQSLHPRCSTLSYILFLTFEITCNTIYKI